MTNRTVLASLTCLWLALCFAGAQETKKKDAKPPLTIKEAFPKIMVGTTYNEISKMIGPGKVVSLIKGEVLARTWEEGTPPNRVRLRVGFSKGRAISKELKELKEPDK